MIETRCVTYDQGPNSCYCGDVDNPWICFDPGRTEAGRVPNGACKAQYERALGTTDRAEIASFFTDTAVPGGKAGFAALGCIGLPCLQECGELR